MSSKTLTIFSTQKELAKALGLNVHYIRAWKEDGVECLQGRYYVLEVVQSFLVESGLQTVASFNHEPPEPKERENTSPCPSPEPTRMMKSKPITAINSASTPRLAGSIIAILAGTASVLGAVIGCVSYHGQRMETLENKIAILASEKSELVSGYEDWLADHSLTKLRKDCGNAADEIDTLAEMVGRHFEWKNELHGDSSYHLQIDRTMTELLTELRAVERLSPKVGAKTAGVEKLVFRARSAMSRMLEALARPDVNPEELQQQVSENLSSLATDLREARI